MRKLISVIGGHAKNTHQDATILAENVGAELAKRGFGVVCGGGDGIMEAACRGCRQAGGLTVGILKGNDPAEANSEVEVAIPTSLDVASNNLVIWSGEGVIAFAGRYGTLNEIALALDFGKPIVLLGKVELLDPMVVTAPYLRHLPKADAVEALDALEALIAQAPAIPARAFTDRAGAWINSFASLAQPNEHWKT